MNRRPGTTRPSTGRRIAIAAGVAVVVARNLRRTRHR